MNTNKDFFKALLLKITIIVGVISPLMTVPQIVKIYSGHTAAGVSIISWFAYALLDTPFVMYGFVYKQKPVAITYTMHLIANLIVAIGAVIYN